MIAHNRPFISAADRSAVDAVLSSGWIAQGPVVASLEARFVDSYGGGAACAVASGTAALFLALTALGAGPGSIIAVPTYSCSALLNSIFMIRGVPRVVDVRADNFCLDADTLRAQATDAQFVLAVHAFGAAADIASLRSQGRIVIEDCCQSLGGALLDRALGAAADAAVFSFYATKIITGGQGGMVWSRNQSVTRQVRDYREFDGRDSYEPRFNFQMTDIQAALVLSQMERLNSIRERRARTARAYLSVLPQGLTTQSGLMDSGRMVHRFVVVAEDRQTRDALRDHMAAGGIGCIVPVETFELLHRYLKLDPAAYPVAEGLADTTLSLPMHLCLSDSDIDATCEVLQKFKP